MPYDFSTWDRNCDKEQSEPLQGTLSGTIPAWLKGSLVCNGPGLMKYGDQEFNHVFDGSAIFQKFEVTETGVVYTSKFLRSNAYVSNSEHKQIVVSEFGTKGSSVSKGVLSKFGEKFQFDKLFSDNAPVTLARYGGSYYATTEAPFLHRVNVDTLETLEKVDLHKLLSINSQCPHPVTLEDGSTINVLSGVGPMGPKYDVVKFPATADAGKENVFAKPTKLASCDTRWKLSPCHMHTFGITGKYAVLPEQPLTVDITALVANTINGKPMIEGMEWLNNKQVKFRVLSLETGKELKLKLKSDSFFYMHTVNCFEQSDHIVLDAVTFKSPSLLHQFKLENLRTKGSALASEVDQGCVRRLVIPLQANDKAAPEENLVKLPGMTATAHRQKDGTIMLTPQILSDLAFENPVVNPAFERKPYTFFYGSSADMTQNKGTVGKVDVRTGQSVQWAVDEDTYSSGHTFVPRPGAQSEDDGVVLIQCLHTERRRLLFVVLDASNFQQLASVTFTLPCDAPRVLHAIFVPAQ